MSKRPLGAGLGSGGAERRRGFPFSLSARKLFFCFDPSIEAAVERCSLSVPFLGAERGEEAFYCLTTYLFFFSFHLWKNAFDLFFLNKNRYLTLAEVFESLRLTAHSLNVDALDMHADKGTFHRFDRFNLKYNPFGQARLREVFIKQDNLLRGRFLAELTREVFVDLEASKYQHAEYRVSIYGRKRVEWDTLAAWVLNNGLYSDNGRR